MEENEYIYSTVPEHLLDEEHARVKALLEFLKERKGKFFTARVLAKEVGYDTRNTCVALRQAITYLIHDQKEPIVACSKGFSYAVHPNQVKVYIESLTFRMKGIERRIRVLQDVMVGMQEVVIDDIR